MDPQVIVIAGSNDHLQSRGLLPCLTDGSNPSKKVIGEAVMTWLSAMTKVEASLQRHRGEAARMPCVILAASVLSLHGDILFVLSPGYATLPEPLQLRLVLSLHGEDHFCVITGVRHIARTLTICVHDGHNSSRGTIQRDNTRTEQNSGPQ